MALQRHMLEEKKSDSDFYRPTLSKPLTYNIWSKNAQEKAAAAKQKQRRHKDRSQPWADNQLMQFNKWKYWETKPPVAWSRPQASFGKPWRIEQWNMVRAMPRFWKKPNPDDEVRDEEFRITNNHISTLKAAPDASLKITQPSTSIPGHVNNVALDKPPIPGSNSTEASTSFSRPVHNLEPAIPGLNSNEPSTSFSQPKHDFIVHKPPVSGWNLTDPSTSFSQPMYDFKVSKPPISGKAFTSSSQAVHDFIKHKSLIAASMFPEPSTSFAQPVQPQISAIKTNEKDCRTKPVLKGPEAYWTNYYNYRSNNIQIVRKEHHGSSKKNETRSETQESKEKGEIRKVNHKHKEESAGHIQNIAGPSKITSAVNKNI